LKALVVKGVYVVAKPITPIFIPLLNSYKLDIFWLGKNIDSPF
jgi:hypothetical protein